MVLQREEAWLSLLGFSASRRMEGQTRQVSGPHASADPAKPSPAAAGTPCPPLPAPGPLAAPALLPRPASQGVAAPRALREQQAPPPGSQHRAARLCLLSLSLRGLACCFLSWVPEQRLLSALGK